MQPVSHEVIEKIVEASAYAPSWKNTQTARYIIIEETALKDRIAREAVISNLDISYYKDKEKLRIGTSVHSAEDAIYAMKHGAAYVTAGHVFATDCKKGLEPRGLHFLKDVCCNVDIPVYAIGGINENNMESCIKAGAAGVCMMSGYMTL